MTRIITIGFLLLFCIEMRAQNDSATIPKMIVKINPLQFIMGEVRLQIEKPINARNSIEITCGYLYKSEFFWLGEIQTSFYNNYGIYGKGYKIGGGYKYYLKKSTEKKKTYFNSVLFYKYVDFYGWEHFNYGGVEDMRYHIICLQMNYGKTSTIKRLIIERYVGLGVRYKYGIIETTPSRPELIIPSPRKQEAWIYPSFYLGCNVGYIFKKQKGEK